jgi:beta-aspartyl-peptidase (threonine type)
MTGIIVHGGAGTWTKAEPQEALPPLEEAALVGWQILKAGGSALDAVEKAAIILEDHPLYDAGYGSYLTQQGEVELDAIIGDGSSFNFGAVAGVKHIKNPIQLARGIMDHSDHNFFIGDGAEDIARTLDIDLIPNMLLVSDREFKRFETRYEQTVYGTVGAVALDQEGKLAVATSTGGTRLKPRGRVGDSPIWGAGAYANPIAAAGATGKGEQIMRVLLSQLAVNYVEQGKPAQQAALRAIATMAEFVPGSEAGLIMMDRGGHYGAAYSTQAMPAAWIGEDGTVHSAMTPDFGL